MPGFNIGGNDNGGAPDAKREPLRAYRWFLQTINAPGVSNGSGSGTSPLSAAAELDIPTFEFEELTVLGMSAEYKFAKRPKFNDIEIQFYDVIGLQDLFEGWMGKIWTPETGFTGDKYKGSLYFQLLDNQGSPLATFSIYQAWPKSLSHTRLSYSDNNLKRLNVKFSYHSYKYAKGNGIK